MGRARYYCAHCNTSFPHTHGARTTHFSGTSHLRAVARWYETPRQRFERKKASPSCHRHLRGQCTFGDKCKYSHSSHQELERLRIEAEYMEILEEFGPPPPQIPFINSAEISKFLDSFNQEDLTKKIPDLGVSENLSRSRTDSSVFSENILSYTVPPPSTFPHTLPPSTTLPPSLG